MCDADSTHTHAQIFSQKQQSRSPSPFVNQKQVASPRRSPIPANPAQLEVRKTSSCNPSLPAITYLSLPKSRQAGDQLVSVAKMEACRLSCALLPKCLAVFNLVGCSTWTHFNAVLDRWQRMMTQKTSGWYTATPPGRMRPAGRSRASTARPSAQPSQTWT